MICFVVVYFVSLIGRDAEEKFRHFFDGLRQTLKHDVMLVEPKYFRAAFDKALRAEQDWKEIEEEHQQKCQAFQLRDQRTSKRPKTNQQKPQEQRPQQPKLLNSVPRIKNNPSCPKFHKSHVGQCGAGQNVCYKCVAPGHFSKDCHQSKQLITSRHT
ncbi:hypothetical protein F511_26330 [Dorcoceras hygrometricum]|uniref:CCHC-type domain-containing protein n=1 Tax=Dorcoceras hygrometricum TaxID=472368 RepID=A0A2Z7BWB2_9LAMI|nr:hypothetical protein F511_26330 [Dorcoceras hygrometricum]